MTTAPQRIQLRRTKGWRMPANTMKVDRTTKWGNPFQVGQLGVPDAATAIERMKRLIDRPDLDDDHARFHLTPARIRADLAGKNLACWCAPDQPCHVDLLLQIANETPLPEHEPKEISDVLP